MTAKQSPQALQAPDGSYYVTLTDGAGNLGTGTVGAAVSGDVASGVADSGNPVKIAGVFNTTPPTVTTGQRVNAQASANGVLYTVIADATGTQQTIVTSNNTDAQGPQVGPFIQAQNKVWNGATWDRMPGSTSGVKVTGNQNDAQAVGGTGISALFEGRTTNKTAVTTGQYVRPIATSIGVQVSKPYQVPELDWQFASASGGIVNTTTAVTIQAAGAAGIRNYCTGVQITAGTLGAATEVAIRDGAAGTVIWRMFLPTGGGTFDVSFATPLKGTAATLMEVVTLTASVTGGVYVNAQGYQAP